MEYPNMCVSLWITLFIVSLGTLDAQRGKAPVANRDITSSEQPEATTAPLPSTTTTKAEPTCLGNLCYEFHSGDDGLDWDAAQAQCVTHGGQLAVVEDPDVNTWVETNMADGDIQSAWIGARREVSAEWIWSNGMPLANGFTPPWYNNEPSMRHTELCVMANPRSSYQWLDRSCDSINFFICETDTPEGQCLAGTDTTDTVFHGGHCFSLRKSEKVSWLQAVGRCGEEGGALPILDTPEVLNAVQDLPLPSGRTIGIWIGLSRTWWRWQDGRTVTRFFWSASPSASGHCVRVQSVRKGDYLWSNAQCNQTSGWICEFDKSRYLTTTTTTTTTTTQKSTNPQNPEPPQPTPSPTPGNGTDQPGALSQEAVIGIGVGGAVIVAVVIIVVVLVLVRRRRAAQDTKAPLIKRKSAAAAPSIGKPSKPPPSIVSDVSRRSHGHVSVGGGGGPGGQAPGAPRSRSGSQVQIASPWGPHQRVPMRGMGPRPAGRGGGAARGVPRPRGPAPLGPPRGPPGPPPGRGRMPYRPPGGARGPGPRPPMTRGVPARGGMGPRPLRPGVPR